MTNTIDIAKYSEKAYLDYCVAVLKNRAIPYLQDGLKPVHRRILYVMNELNLKSNGTPKKSARIVGDIIGKYHPHGDSAVYEAMVKMSQDFYLRYPLVDGQGNFGSRDGDSAAAMRYTEAKLTPIAELLLNDLKYDCTRFKENYDNTLYEPDLLPSRLNFLLMNGVFGIAVGLSTNIPSHNINDVTNATIAYIDNPEIEIEELAKIINAPDLPTGGQIITPKQDIIDAYKEGFGTFTVRCRWHEEKQGRGQYRIVITELPPSRSVEGILQKIDSIENPKQVKDKSGKTKKLSNKAMTDKAYLQNLISNAFNDSEKGNLRLIIEPKSSKIDANELMEKLYKILDLEENVKIDFTCVGNDLLPKRKNLKEMISEWVVFRFATVTRRITNLLKKTNERIHILDGRKIAFDHIDEIIKIIKEEDESEKILMERFNLSEIQAKDILEIKLRQLAKMEIDKIIKELDALDKDKKRYESLLSSDKKMMNLIKKEIIEDTEKYSDERKTVVKEAEKAVITNDDKIIDEKVTLIINEHGWLTLRKGHDIDQETVLLRDNSKIVQTIEMINTENVFILNKAGRIFNFKAHQVPSGKNFIHLNSLIDNNEDVVLIDKVIENKNIFFASSLGYGFITSGESLLTKNKAGKQFLTVENGYPHVPIYINDEKFASCKSNNGKLLTFNLDEIKFLKNGGKGVQLIKLNDDESMDYCTIHTDNFIKIKNKKINTDDYLLKRARRGKNI